MSTAPISEPPIQELRAEYDPAELAEKVSRRRRLMRSRLTSLVITVVLMIALYLWRGAQLQGAGFFAVYGLVFGVSLAWFLVTLIAYRRARSALAGMGTGTAVRIGPPGIQVAGLAAPWSQVSAVTTVNLGRGPAMLARGAALRLQLTDGRRADLPLDQVSVLPGTLDGTVRAFSGGRFGVDLSALEN
jgi:hypothetical protein